MPKNLNNKYKTIKMSLLTERQALDKKIQSRLGEVSIEREPDDEVAQATSSVARDMMAATIERERETLTEIDAALKRIAKDGYGVCESCGSPISEARLRALPWASQCISCANGGNATSTRYFRLRTAS